LQHHPTSTKTSTAVGQHRQKKLLWKFLNEVPAQRLSRKPPYLLATQLIDENFNAKEKWKELWSVANVKNSELVDDPS